MKGGGGAIDLVMHVNKFDFKQAVVWLSDRFGEIATIETVSQQKARNYPIRFPTRIYAPSN